jgi:hypothetical protein
MGERRGFTKEFKERTAELALKTNLKLGIIGNTLARRMREMKRSEGGR